METKNNKYLKANNLKKFKIYYLKQKEKNN